MIQIKIYNKAFVPITTFNVGEYGALQYRKTLRQIGDCSFTLDSDNTKITPASIRNYNRIEVSVDGIVEWVGYIVSKTITLNIVTIQCKELIGILGKRLTPDAYTLSGNAGAAVGTLLAMINAGDPTGITMGATDISTSINMTFNQQDALSVLQNIADNVGGQFIVNNDRTLDFKSTLGEDVSSTVRLEYSVLRPQQANITKFEVSDNGENIVTKSYGAATGITSAQDDLTLQGLYGILEKFNLFSQANSQPNLDALTASKLTDTLYSPNVTLNPGEGDNFNICDIVGVYIQNDLIDIDDSFQVLEKSVKIKSGQKEIAIKINQLPQDIVNDIKELQKKVGVLETN